LISCSCSQGGADRPLPCYCQGDQVGRVHSHEAALVESATVGRERGGGDGATTRHGRGRGVAARGGGCVDGHDYSDYHTNGSTSACPRC
jgi:hypothetical protein